MHSNLNRDRTFKKRDSALLEEANNINSSPDFECNICLDLVQDPVVTFCGHLYCWPCIYKWIVSSRNTPHEYQNPQCPICKKDVSEDAIIPLYGQGQTTTTTSCSSSLDYPIPQRPTNPRCTNNSYSSLDNTRDYYSPRVPSYTRQSGVYDHSSYPAFGFGDSTRYRLFDPMIGMLGDIVCSGMFGSSGSPFYTYPNSYDLADRSSPRRTRRIVEADRSLGRIYFFLCCCVSMCLILF